MHFNFLLWEEGLAVLFVDNLPDQHHSTGHGSTSDPLYRQTGWARSNEGSEYRWEIRTADGVTAEIDIDGTAYDAAKGTVFVVRHTGEEAAVSQLDLDLSGLSSASVAGCQAFIREHKGRLTPNVDTPGQP